MTRPMIFMDVDGVLNPDFSDSDLAASLGYREILYTGPLLDEQRPDTRMFVWFNRSHGTWLRELAATADLVWATSWEGATSWLNILYGLPDDIPWLPVGRSGGVVWGRTVKSPVVMKAIEAAGNPPVIWVDDVFGGKDFGWAEDRAATGNPVLLVGVDTWLGLTPQHMADTLTQLHAMASSP